MRLTVGPLPAAVYWRRRAVVLVGLAMIVLVVSYSCGGGSNASSAGQTTPSVTQSATPTPTTTLLHPTVPTTSPQQSAFTLPSSGATGPCTDAEMDLVAGAGSGQVQRGQSVDVTLRIKNISNRTCSRDVGATAQELRLMDGDIVVWSSDDCNARSGTDVRSFSPGKEISFTLTWGGMRSRTGTGAVNCSAPAPDAKTYQLLARLDQKLSTPFSLRIVS
jgi:hypothetical protein